jgi:hypothetical protein
MKLFILIATLLLPAPLPQGPRGAVTGRVIVSGTTEPIADADIAIVTTEGVLESTTDAAGRFAVANVPVGRQTVLIRADGFFIESTSPNTPFAARAEVPVTITAGGTPVAIPNVSMVRSGIISGKVVDPQGNPLPFIRVQAFRPDAAALNSGVVPDSGNRMTDDRGEYRMFFVPPGEYVIRAQVQGGRPAGPVQTRPGELQTLVTTLFPSTTDLAQAGKVIVKSGEEARGIDISVKTESVIIPPPDANPKPAGGFKISGVVVDRVLPWVGEAVLMLGSEADAAAPRQVGTVIIGGNRVSLKFHRFLRGNTISSLECRMPMDLPAREAAYRRGGARPLKLWITMSRTSASCFTQASMCRASLGSMESWQQAEH